MISLYTAQHAPLWVTLETLSCSPVSSHLLLWLSPKSRPALLSPLMSHSVRVWDSTKYSSVLISPHLPLLPLLVSPLFSPGLGSPSAFLCQVSHKFPCIHSFLTGLSVFTWAEIRDKYQAPYTECFRFLQIKHWLTSVFANRDLTTQLALFEHVCHWMPLFPKYISTLYSQLNNLKNPNSHTYVSRWEEDLKSTKDGKLVTNLGHNDFLFHYYPHNQIGF